MKRVKRDIKIRVRNDSFTDADGLTLVVTKLITKRESQLQLGLLKHQNGVERVKVTFLTLIINECYKLKFVL